MTNLLVVFKFHSFYKGDLYTYSKPVHIRSNVTDSEVHTPQRGMLAKHVKGTRMKSGTSQIFLKLLTMKVDHFIECWEQF